MYVHNMYVVMDMYVHKTGKMFMFVYLSMYMCTLYSNCKRREKIVQNNIYKFKICAFYTNDKYVYTYILVS